MAARRPAVVKLAVTPSRLTDQLAFPDAAAAAAGTPVVLIAMGADRPAVAPPRRARRLVLDLRRRGHRARAGDAGADAVAVTASGSTRPTRRCSAWPDGPSAIPGRRRCTTPPCRPSASTASTCRSRRRTSTTCWPPPTAFGVRGLSVTAPFKLDALARAVVGRSAGRPARRGQHAHAHARRLGREQHRRRGLPASAAFAAHARGRPGGGAGRGRRRACSRRRPACRRRARHRPRASPRPGRGARAAGRHGGGVAARRPARGTCWSTPRPWARRRTSRTRRSTRRVLAGGGLVYDLVYNPGRTRLLRDAAAAGCETLGGLEMLIAQAAVQVATWFPVDPPVDAMRAAIHAEAPQLALETSCPR